MITVFVGVVVFEGCSVRWRRGDRSDSVPIKCVIVHLSKCIESYMRLLELSHRNTHKLHTQSLNGSGADRALIEVSSLLASGGSSE